MLTDRTTLIPMATLARPDYLVPVALPGYDTHAARITGNTGQAVKDGTWGKDARHHYSKDQPWSPDGSMLGLEQKGGTPSKLICDGQSYRPLVTSESNSTPGHLLRAAYEWRWRPGHGHQIVSWQASNHTLVVWDALDGTIEWSVQIPSDAPEFGFLSEGNLTDDGNRLVLGTRFPAPQSQVTQSLDYFQVVDLANHRVGPRVFVPIHYATEDHGDVDWMSISPLGGFVVVKYSNQHKPEYHRCYALHPDLSASPQPMSPIGLRMWDTQHDTAGFLACLSHADFNVDRGREVLVGGIRDQDHSNVSNSAQVHAEGRIVLVDLATGRHRSVSAGSRFLPAGMHEAEDQHTSGQARRARGWHLATYTGTTGQFASEMVAWALDGSRACKRFGVTHALDNDYRREAHGVPDDDLKRVLWASNFRLAGDGPADDDVKAYVVG